MQLAGRTPRQRRAKQDRAAYTALLANPASGSFVLPANADLGFRALTAVQAVTAAGTVGGVTVSAGPMPANGIVRFRGSRAQQVTALAGFKAVIDIGLGRFRKIGGA